MLKLKEAETGICFANNHKLRALKRSLRENWDLYLLLVLPILFFVIFKYRPMTALIIAFKNYKFNLGYWHSPWASNYGFGNFIRFLKIHILATSCGTPLA